MRLRPIEDDSESEYWAGQLRLGTWIAVALTTLGTLRVAVGWTHHRWMVGALVFATLAQLVLIRVPWARLVRRPGFREGLFSWWLAELPFLYVFSRYDDAGLTFYVPGAMLVVTLAVALYPPRMIIGLGAASLVGFVALIPSQESPSVALFIGLGAALVTVVGLGVITADNRGRQTARRRTAERRTEALLENASDAVFAVAPDSTVNYASPSVREVFGHEPDRMLGTRLGELIHPDDLPQVTERVAALFAGPAGHTMRMDARMRRADGAWIYADAIATNRKDDPDVLGAVVSIRDIGPRRALEEELSRQAFADSLTGLANRALFRDRVGHAVARNRRGAGRVTLLLIDLDDFKLVNDTLGHSAGDHLLTTVADRLREHVRPSDTLARLGGDEFAILVEDLDEVESAALAERILQAVRRPVRLVNREVVCSMSIGIATAKSGEDAPDTEELLRYADLAMYAAKRAGRDRFALFDPAMYVDVLREAQQRVDLEQALQHDQFLVHYQPIVDLPGRTLIGFEALVRWQHPGEGVVGPTGFIPIAEATGLIVPLGKWVLRRACEQLARWHDAWPDQRHLRMSVNLSARQFQYVGLVDDVAAVLAETGVDPSALVLEITESMLMQDTEATIVTLQALRDLGVRLAIDDFGTGYSSLSYLKRFPVDILKIDRSFVGGVHSDPHDASLAEAVVGLGRALRLQTVAEGIETSAQWSVLRELGCDYGQGYLFARPVDAAEIEVLLADPGSVGVVV